MGTNEMSGKPDEMLEEWCDTYFYYLLTAYM